MSQTLTFMNHTSSPRVVRTTQGHVVRFAPNQEREVPAFLAEEVMGVGGLAPVNTEATEKVIADQAAAEEEAARKRSEAAKKAAATRKAKAEAAKAEANKD